MSGNVGFATNKASEAQVARHLLYCDADFIPKLSARVEITEYARKVASKAIRFEAWWGNELVGMVAAYCNDQEKHFAYITSVSVLRGWTGKRIATSLIRQLIEYSRVLGMQQIRLEVASANVPAIRLYEKIGFLADKRANEPYVTMELCLK